MKTAGAARGGAKEGGAREHHGAAGEPRSREPGRPSPVAALHAAAGNAAVARWVGALQGASAPELVTRTLSRTGEPLEGGLRREMEQRFGQDFGGVRVHADALAARSARAERARAYTVGDAIVFGSARPSPTSAAGRLLVAHELAHVVQQRGGGGLPASGPDGHLEEGADRAVQDVALGRRPRLAPAGAVRLSRAPEDDEEKRAKYAEWGQAYQTLRRLEEQAYHRVHELHDQGTAHEAAQRQRRAAKTGKPPFDAPDMASYNVQYSVHNGRLVTYVSAEKGRRRGVQLQPGEVWVGARGAHTDEEAHAERNTLRLGPGQPITAVASRPHCEHCSRALQGAGASTGGERVNPGEMNPKPLPGPRSKKDAQERQKLADRRKDVEDRRQRMLQIPHTIGTALERIQTIKDPAAPRPTPEVLRRAPPGGSVTGTGHPSTSPGTPTSVPATDTSHTTPGSAVPHVTPGIGSTHPPAGPGTGPPPSTATTAHPSPGKKDDLPGPGTGVPHTVAAVGTTGSAAGTTGVQPPPASRIDDRRARDLGEQIAPGVYRRRKPASDPTGATPSHQGSPTGPSGDAAWPKFAEFMKTVEPTGKGATPARRSQARGGEDPNAPPGTTRPARPTPTAKKPNRQSGQGTPTRPPTTEAAGHATPPSPPPTTHAPPTPKVQTPPPATPPVTTTAPAARSGTPAATAGAAHHEAPVDQPGPPPPSHGGTAASTTAPPTSTRKPPSPPLPNLSPSGSRTTGGPPGGGGGGGGGGTGALSASHPTTTTAAPPPTTTTATAGTGTAPRSTVQPDPAKPGTKLSWTGVSRTRTTEERADDVVASKGRTTSLTRDKGRLGVGSTTSRRFGQEDEQGNLIKGHETSRSHSGGLVAGPGGVGGFATAEGTATQAHGHGLKTTQSIGVDGQATVDVKPVPGTTPPQYKMTVVITLGGHASVGGSVDRGQAGVSGTASLQGSVSGVFEHTFTKEEVDHYLGAMKDPAAGGAEKEFRIMRLATKGSLQEAKALLATVGSAGMSPEAIAHMKEGDASEVTVSGKGELGAGVHGQGEVVGFSLGASLSRSGSLRRRVAIKDGKALVTVEVLASKGASGAASLSLYGAEAGGGYGQMETTGESVTFSVDPKDAAALNRIAAADSAGALRSLAASPGGATIVSRTQSHEKTTSTTAKVGLLGAEAEVGTEHTYGEKKITDPHGVTREFTGGSGGKLSVGAKGGPHVSYGEKDTVVLAGGPENQGYGDVSSRTTETDLTKSVRDAKQAPVRTALGAATGGAPVLAESEEVVGMKLSNADFTRISAAAFDNKAWNDAFLDSNSRVNQSHADATRLASRIRNAGGDRTAIAQAFAQYAEQNDNAAKFVQSIVRPRGETEGGRRYDWPAEYANEQSIYETLVLGDPGAEADRLATSGQVPAAVQSLRDAVAHLETVAGTVNANKERFSDKAAVSEMLRSIRRRQHDLNKKVQELQPAPHPEVAKADPANHDPAKKETPPKEPGTDATGHTDETKPAPDPAAVSRAQDELRHYIADCQTNRVEEQAKFTTIDSEYHHWYRNASPATILPILSNLHDRLYKMWDQQINDMKKLYQEMGQDPNQALQYGPDRAGWRKRRNDPEMTKWGQSWQGD